MRVDDGSQKVKKLKRYIMEVAVVQSCGGKIEFDPSKNGRKREKKRVRTEN